jgi:sigma-B regulation protein RsbU (phosphoserine phosphatase)
MWSHCTSKNVSSEVINTDKHGPSMPFRRTQFRTWSVGRLIFVPLLIAGVIFLATSSITTVLTLQVRESLNLQSRTYQASEQNVSSLLTALVDAETGERGFLITSETRYLQPYTYGTNQAPILLRLLKHRLGRYEGLTAQLRTITARYDEWQRTVAIPAIEDVSKRDPSLAIAAERSGYAKLQFDRLRSVVGRLNQTLHIDYTTSSRQTHDYLNTILLFLPLKLLLIIALIATVWLLMVRHVTKPIRVLASQARSIADGDVNLSISSQGPLEIERLGNDLEAMRQRLRSDTEQLRQLRGALRRHSPLTMMVHRELEATTATSQLRFAGEVSPAEGVLAGDWYDIWEYEDRVSLVLMDVSGHGAEAGMIALRIKHLVDPPIQMGLEPGEILTWLRDFIGPLGDASATGIVMTIDFTRGFCSYANAGHPSGLIVSSGEIRELQRTGPLLSDLGGAWTTEATPIQPGDLLLCVTDGILEARLDSGEEYGLQRLIELARSASDEQEPEAIIDLVMSSVHAICTTPLRDDATVVAVQIAIPSQPALEP